MQRFDADDVWTAIVGRRGDSGEQVDSGDLRGTEWEAFTADSPPTSDDFTIRTLDIPDGPQKERLGRPVAVDRLREVRALCGFTRIDGPDEGDPTRIAPIWNTPQNWLPAAEIRGEGILITLSEARIERWERGFRETGRYGDLQRATRNWRTRRGLEPEGTTPPPRFVLLHTMSHLLMRQVALECGYSTASIRERLYCREPGASDGSPMAGVLLYTAAPDSEGTLGGLVALSEPARLAAVLRDALKGAKPGCTEGERGCSREERGLGAPLNLGEWS